MNNIFGIESVPLAEATGGQKGANRKENAESKPYYIREMGGGKDDSTSC